MGKIMMNGIQYGVGGIEKAKDISYDNTSSGMSATNVQGALDEVKSGLTDADAVLASLSIRELTLPYTVAANGIYNANLKTRIDATLPTGYKCLGIVGITSNNNSVFPIAFRYSASDYSLGLKNTSGSSVSTNAIVAYLCMKA